MGIFFVRSIHAGMGVGLKFFIFFLFFFVDVSTERVVCWTTQCPWEWAMFIHLCSLYFNSWCGIPVTLPLPYQIPPPYFSKKKKATGVHEVSFHTFFFFLVLVRSGMGWAGPPSFSLLFSYPLFTPLFPYLLYLRPFGDWFQPIKARQWGLSNICFMSDISFYLSRPGLGWVHFFIHFFLRTQMEHAVTHAWDLTFQKKKKRIGPLGDSNGWLAKKRRTRNKAKRIKNFLKHNRDYSIFQNFSSSCLLACFRFLACLSSAFIWLPFDESPWWTFAVARRRSGELFAIIIIFAWGRQMTGRKRG